MKIAVTSENKLKVNAVRTAYQPLDANLTLQGYTADSKIGEQPTNGLALEGARNRIKDVKSRVSGLDRIVSIESGIFKEGKDWVDRAVVVIYDPKTDKEHIAYSDPVVFPTEYVEKAMVMGFDKFTVGKIMAEAGYVADNKDPHKSITGKSRQQYIEETLQRLVLDVERKR